MQYRVIGIMSGSSLDGLDIAYAEFEETGGKWNFDIKAADCIPYDAGWTRKLQTIKYAPALDYLTTHTSYGRFIGEQVNRFIWENDLQHKVQLIASHGHTVFHSPASFMTAQLGDGAAIAAVTGINVVSDLRSIDVALGGQGAPIVPVGEKLLLPDYDYFLNIGGIVNLSANRLAPSNTCIAFDVCPGNRILNLLAAKTGNPFDDKGLMAKAGSVHTGLLTALNAFDYYKEPFPKSLSNEFGTDIIFPLIESFGLAPADALRTYTEHIAQQVGYAINAINPVASFQKKRLLVTGGGAFNDFLIGRIIAVTAVMGIEVCLPAEDLIKFKEALIMALLGILRWREENTALASVTGAARDSIGGAVWIGQEA